MLMTKVFHYFFLDSNTLAVAVDQRRVQVKD